MTHMSQKSKTFRKRILLKISYIRRMKIFNSKQMQIRVDFFGNQMRFHVRKEPQNDPKITKSSKKFNIIDVFIPFFRNIELNF